VIATGFSGEQTETTTWLLKAIGMLRGKTLELMSTIERGKELADIRARMEELELWMQQKAKLRWVYEWPMRKAKEKWPVKQLMVIKQRRLIRGWLRYVENLNGPEEEMVQICEPETGRNLSEMRLVEDIKHCQEGREEIPNCQWARS
jgi:hypothetical protein